VFSLVAFLFAMAQGLGELAVKEHALSIRDIYDT